MTDVLLIGMDIDHEVKAYMADNPGVGYEAAFYEVQRAYPKRFVTYSHQAHERPQMRLQDAAALELTEIAAADKEAADADDALRRAARQHPDVFRAYASVPDRVVIEPPPPVAARAAITRFPNGLRVEPRGPLAGPDHWLVYRDEDEVGSFPTEAEAVAYAKGLLRMGTQVHSRRYAIVATQGGPQSER